jgi:hypothetical protein
MHKFNKPTIKQMRGLKVSASVNNKEHVVTGISQVATNIDSSKLG